MEGRPSLFTAAHGGQWPNGNATTLRDDGGYRAVALPGSNSAGCRNIEVGSKELEQHFFIEFVLPDSAVPVLTVVDRDERQLLLFSWSEMKDSASARV